MALTIASRNPKPKRSPAAACTGSELLGLEAGSIWVESSKLELRISWFTLGSGSKKMVENK